VWEGERRTADHAITSHPGMHERPLLFITRPKNSDKSVRRTERANVQPSASNGSHILSHICCVLRVFSELLIKIECGNYSADRTKLHNGYVAKQQNVVSNVFQGVSRDWHGLLTSPRLSNYSRTSLQNHHKNTLNLALRSSQYSDELVAVLQNVLNSHRGQTFEKKTGLCTGP